MDATKEILPYLKLRLELEHPDLEDCWTEGFKHASRDGEQVDNPYKIGTVEAEYWEQGWWAGFYEEPSWSPKRLTVANEGNFTRVALTQAANEPNWTSDKIRRWTSNVIKVASIVAVTVAAFEMLDLAS